jgi:RNA polymerase-binding transcription factor DksA
MTDTTVFKNKLEEMLLRVTEELNLIANYEESTDNWEATPVGTEVGEADENSEADVVEEWNERRATVSVLETDYRNIVRALEKISAGTYGICEISGNQIEEKRLLANPTARTCVAHMNDEGSLSL